ncbi:hypothetical protein HYDPIDRAFT_34030 [Hydnomerulius pinastri MD-312]|uniref:Ubiquitin-like protease family profile domain-containing protein n=1 Tax=Hydnomerulius pinastri MD-312 TaxID=994086 RepID=A0A0C9W6Z3_9AGAM|nr:hypothetical protein HYDPIDRAFT_34030 [Hydnomerulius pinastri MD-312]
MAEYQGSGSPQATPNEVELSQAAADDLEYDVPDDIDDEFSELSTPAPTVNAAPRLFESWKTVIPTLVDPFLWYLTQTLGKPVSPPNSTISHCMGACESKKTTLVCLHFNHFTSITVLACKCASLPQVLLHHGLFPTAPSQPRMAVSIELLAFYRALFKRSCDAINALAAALNSHYTQRGFRMTGRDGNRVQEPFRRSLGHAVQWFDVLQVEVENRVESTLTHCQERVSAARVSTSPQCNMQPDHPRDSQREPAPKLSPQDAAQPPHRNACDQLLVQRCPACFGGNSFGRPLSDGGDIHVATDGNFHHRHRRSTGNCPTFYAPVYFLPKTQVDAVGQRIAKAHKRQPKKHKALVPDKAIDQCKTSYEAADGKKQKAAMDSFDNTGVMALICRHDIPLFFMNIDTPANVVVLYDVRCILACSLNQYDILDSSITSCLRFATTAMHAYGHKWACQLIYNPQLAVGLGLSDGEGTERLWSCFIKLIGIERASSRQRRIWLIDRQATAAGYEMHKDLGSWLKRQMKKGVGEQGDAAQKVLESCGDSVTELRDQWTRQCAAQLSVRAHAPARLKKELDSVLALQADLDSSERALQTARAALEKDCASEQALDVLDSMEHSHSHLLDKVEALYTSLNDLKMNIRKRAIGSFFEWDKLDRAVGGKDKALGTKLHQQTRKAIAKHQPALMSTIKKFNKYCKQLEEAYDPAYAIPLPTPLPTKLADLRNNQTLLQDVWIAPSIGEIPRWLEDSSIRDGIRALLKRDHCREEQHRLGIEADNMCHWFSLELSAVELALQQPENSSFRLILQHRREAMLELQEQWPTTLASSVRYAGQAKEAVSLAKSLSGISSTMELYWLTPVVCSLPSENVAEEDGESMGMDDSGPVTDSEPTLDPDQVLLGDVLVGGEIGNNDNDNDNEKDDVLPSVDLLWNLPQNRSIDFRVIDIPHTTQVVTGNIVRQIWPPTDGFPWLTFEPKDIEILRSKEARLNDVCVNGCAVLLFSRYLSPHSNQIAIFSTHDLPRIRYNASDDVLWCNTSWTKYWEKSIWILPIHQPSLCGHWVLCTIDLTSQRLFLFDSLAEQRPWKNDVQDALVTMRGDYLANAAVAHACTN